MKPTLQRIDDAICDAAIKVIVWQADRERAVKAGQPVPAIRDLIRARLTRSKP